MDDANAKKMLMPCQRVPRSINRPHWLGKQIREMHIPCRRAPKTESESTEEGADRADTLPYTCFSACLWPPLFCSVLLFCCSLLIAGPGISLYWPAVLYGKTWPQPLSPWTSGRYILWICFMLRFPESLRQHGPCVCAVDLRGSHQHKASDWP